MEEYSLSSPSENKCPSTPDIVKVVLRLHEGVEADQPFSLLTTQTVSCHDTWALLTGPQIIFILGLGPICVCGKISHWVLAREYSHWVFSYTCTCCMECGPMCSCAQVLPAKGHGSLEVSFYPSIACYNELGRVINGYLLGYISLDTEVSTCMRN